MLCYTITSAKFPLRGGDGKVWVRFNAALWQWPLLASSPQAFQPGRGRAWLSRSSPSIRSRRRSLRGSRSRSCLWTGPPSPHSYALKPSDAKALSEADAVIFASRNLEVFLERALATLPAKARVIELEKTPGLRLLPVRAGGLHEASEEAGDDHDRGGHGHRHGGGFDVHFWLDPLNAVAMARYLAAEFSGVDPAHAAQYRANAAKLEGALTALDAELKATLSGLGGPALHRVPRCHAVFRGAVRLEQRRIDHGQPGASPEGRSGSPRCGRGSRTPRLFACRHPSFRPSSCRC